MGQEGSCRVRGASPWLEQQFDEAAARAEQSINPPWRASRLGREPILQNGRRTSALVRMKGQKNDYNDAEAIKPVHART
jgi:hypothetical protein